MDLKQLVEDAILAKVEEVKQSAGKEGGTFEATASIKAEYGPTSVSIKLPLLITVDSKLR